MPTKRTVARPEAFEDLSWQQVLVVEDDAATSRRRRLIAIGGEVRNSVKVRLHSVAEEGRTLLDQRVYQAGRLLSKRGRGKAAIALALIDAHTPARNAVVVAGATYGSNRDFLEGLVDRGLPFVVEVRPSELYSKSRWQLLARRYIARKLGEAPSQQVKMLSPSGEGTFEFLAAPIEGVTPHPRLAGRVFVAQTGGIEGLHRGTIIGFASPGEHSVDELVRAVAWARWIRPSQRRAVRQEASGGERIERTVALKGARLTVRTSIANAERQDDRLRDVERTAPALQSVLSTRPALNVVELFAGAGGMGLGFLLAKCGRYRIIHSAEVNPIYVSTLRRNHEFLAGVGG